MPRIEIETFVQAPRDLVFDLARSIDVHQHSQLLRKERAVAGRTFGLIELDESITWEAVHFGIRQRLTSKITAMKRPHHFRDSMVSGAFQRFDHDHWFEIAGTDRTIMRDAFDFTSPAGVLGRLADALFLTSYMKALLIGRNRVLKEIAESADAGRFLSLE